MNIANFLRTPIFKEHLRMAASKQKVFKIFQKYSQVSYRKTILKISKSSHENTCDGILSGKATSLLKESLFTNSFQALLRNFSKQLLLEQMFLT